MSGYNKKQFSNVAGVLASERRAVGELVPPPDILPSEWAEQNVKIPVGNAIPGPINFDNAPYQRGMLNAIKEKGVRRIDYMTGAQLGKTTIQQIGVGYFIAYEPRSQIFAQPTQGDMQTFLETKLKPMVQANPNISRKMAKPRSREGTNNSRIISYNAGWLMFSWAGSPKTARGRSAPVVHMDECDGYESTAEGDFCELLSQRNATFGDQRLETRSSTPTVMGASRIHTGFLEGDQRRFYVACPDCGESQYFRWENVTWIGRKSKGIEDAESDIDQEHEPDTARYCCVGCGSLWDDGQRIAAIRNAEKHGQGWKAAKPFKGHASFHAPEMLSTFRRLRDIVQSYLDKLAVGDLQSFVNVSLAWPYESGEKIDPDSLLGRREEYAAQVPMGGLYLTAGIDQQMDRLECEVVAWGVGEESWSIDYRVFWGDPLGDDVWLELEDYLGEPFIHESGAFMAISAACLDTGGTSGMTQRAYEWLRGKTGRRIFGVKGVGGWGRPIVEKPQRKQSGKNARKVDLFLVGTDEAKLAVSKRLAVIKEGPNYCHFPIDRDPEYFKQLTAERLNVKYVKGQAVREWVKPDRARNEALDTRVYALAALKIMNPSFQKLRIRLGASGQKPQEKKEPETQAASIESSPPEKTQEDTTPPKLENRSIIKPRRKLKSSVSGGNWAKKW
jgi:phage terminase large subunit GpA-like protein